MIEVDLYNYWTKNLSLRNLSKLKDYKAVCNIKNILIKIFIIPNLVLYLLFLFNPIITCLFSVDYDRLVYYVLANGIIVLFLLALNPEQEAKKLVHRHKGKVDIYELKEKKLKNYIETKWQSRGEGNTEFYKEVIRLCEKKGNCGTIDMSVFYTLLGVALTLFVFVFDGVNGINTRMIISYTAFGVFFILIMGYSFFVRSINKSRYGYSTLADALSRILIKTQQGINR